MIIKEFEIDNKKITLYSCGQARAPNVYMNTYQGDGQDVLAMCHKINCSAFNFIVISGLSWDDDLTPWECPPIYSDDGIYKGAGDIHLNRIVNKIMPEAENILGEKPKFSALSGYSLAGLFTCYAAFKTNKFSRFMSASGSLWFPKFIDFVQKNKLCAKPDAFYLSLGDQESDTKIKTVAKVGENTQKFYEFLQDQKVKSIYKINEGDHFKNIALRCASGIKWILSCMR